MQSRPRTRVQVAAIAAALTLLATMTGSAAAAHGKAAHAAGQQAAITRLGTSHLSAKASKTSYPSVSGEGELRGEPESDAVNREISGNRSYAHVPSRNVPRPATLPVVKDWSGFAGLDHYDNRYPDQSSTVNTQFSLEPPDQALCVGAGYIVESVNTVVRVRGTDGADITGAVPLNEFFKLAPEVVRADDPTQSVYGDFTSDPKCLFDPADGGHFFLTLLQADVIPEYPGNFAGPTSVLVAVSNSNNPTGAWTIYKIDTTNDSPDGSDTCPCLGDQPLIGADANGFYVSTNVFPLFDNGYNGAMVYAFDKAALEAGSATPNSQAISVPTLAEDQAYSLQPAITPPGGTYATADGGTEYFMSALDFHGKTDNRVAVWKLTNTSSLATTPDLSLDSHLVRTVTYGQPPAVIQKAGPTPLIDFLKLAKASTEHLSMLNSNDDRMNQVTFAGGLLWGAVNTAVKGATGPTRTGIAYFIVDPSGTPSMVKDGYVAVDTNSVMFPAIAATADGAGVMSFTLAGPTAYPSAAYVTLDADNGAGDVTVVKAGDGPSDGFSGLGYFGGASVARWGDYGAAAVDSNGTIWFAAETINQSCGLGEFLVDYPDSTCGGTRSFYANWGTWIASVTP